MPTRLQALLILRRDITSLWLAWLLAALFLAGCATTHPGGDPLPSWNEGATKTAIVKFVRDTTTPGSPDFVPVADRIATFDNDGTLWSEHPMYVEVVYTLDRVRELAKANPPWRNEMPFKAVIDNDKAAMAKFAEADFFKLIAVTHAGYTSAEFQKSAAAWLASARHPRFHRPYTDLVYQPMLELLAYFRANGYKTFIVSGGTINMMRSFTDRVYGFPPEQVIGTSFQGEYTFADNVALTRAKPALMLLDDGPGKAVGIDHFIGRTPIASFGNSDGDIAMLQTATHSPDSPKYRRFGAFVWHTDGVREYAYDRNTHVGRLAEGLDLAPKLGWTLIDMKKDWKVIFPYELRK